METKNNLHEPIKLEHRLRKQSVRYVASDGEVFTDRELYRKHCYKLNLEQLRIIHEPHFFKDKLHWYTLAVFIAGYLFGVFCSFT